MVTWEPWRELCVHGAREPQRSYKKDHGQDMPRNILGSSLPINLQMFSLLMKMKYLYLVPLYVVLRAFIFSPFIFSPQSIHINFWLWRFGGCFSPPFTPIFTLRVTIIKIAKNIYISILHAAMCVCVCIHPTEADNAFFMKAYTSRKRISKMANKHMEKVSPSWVIKVQVKTPMRYHYSSIRMAKIKRTDSTKSWQGYGTTGILQCWWESELNQSLWKRVCQYLQTLTHAYCTLGVYSREMGMCAHEWTHTVIFIAVLFLLVPNWKNPNVPNQENG